MQKIRAALVSLLLLAGCTQTSSVAVISSNGEIMRGTATGSLSGGSFRVDGGGRTCSGSYDSFDQSLTISIPFNCSDGKKGIALVTRDPCMCSGSGRVRMQDGTEADFVFGKAAEAF